MSPVVLYAAALIVLIHGLIHLMGFVSYWRLAVIEGVPYKTTLLNGAWEVGEAGIRLFGALWLVAAAAFILADIGLVTGQSWWPPLMVGAAVLSLVITALAWRVAYTGVVINVVILALLLIVPRLTG